MSMVFCSGEISVESIVIVFCNLKSSCFTDNHYILCVLSWDRFKIICILFLFFRKKEICISKNRRVINLKSEIVKLVFHLKGKGNYNKHSRSSDIAVLKPIFGSPSKKCVQDTFVSFVLELENIFLLLKNDGPNKWFVKIYWILLISCKVFLMTSCSDTRKCVH